jgi:hypothetical protein
VIAAALFLGALASASPPAQVGADRAQSCAVCHGAESKQHAAGIHARGEIDCISCHGGVAGELVVERAHGDDLRPLGEPREIVESCGGCHADVERMRLFGLRTDQLSLYWTSRHGAQLAKEGDSNVAICTTCHGTHEILPVADPRSPVHGARQIETCGRCHSDAARMAGYALRTDVVERYRSSVHGHALIDRGYLSAPACSDCHGSHGAVPPRVGDIEFVCGQCHATAQRYFEESPHFSGVSGGASVQCTACHDNHGVSPPSTAMFLGDEPGHCGDCHSDEGDPARLVAAKLHDEVEALNATIAEADDVIGAAAKRGLFLGEERAYLDEARGLLVRARSMTHTLSPTALGDVLNRGRAMVETTLESLATKQRGYRDRRIFTGVFLGVALACSIALWMYARTLGGRWKLSRASTSGGGRGA